MKKSIFWFRRDLRLEDNAGLYHALRESVGLVPIFIFDEAILEGLPKDDARVTFIHQTLMALNDQLKGLHSRLFVYHGDVMKCWKEILEEHKPSSVYCNRDYEPGAIKRDQTVATYLTKEGVNFFDYKDHVVFDTHEVLKDDGRPYTVFTPYKRKWLSKLVSKGPFYKKSYPTEKYFANFIEVPFKNIMHLKDIGFTQSQQLFPPPTVSRSIIKKYDQTRDYPAINGTSRLGIHYRFGTISIRQKLDAALDLNETYVSELIWRDFYSMILWHFPHVETNAFRPEYDKINWRNNEGEFKAWCEGNTGYPLVDAGMRELNQTGYMHNRVRMVVASFLTKHLLIDWRWGEAYFALKLLDFDLSSNNGGWQWAAGCGTDAAPYFRIFNPGSQMEKFDPQSEYIKKWVPEYNTSKYPSPIVDHKFARERCLNTYKVALS